MTTVAETTTRRGPGTRADALRNRERIVAAAREVFVEFGPEAPLDEIARRAGIGNATLYRHFADRCSLVSGVLVSVIDRTAHRADEIAAQETDPFTAVCRFAHAAVDEGVGVLCGMFVGGFVEESCPDVRVHGDRLEKTVEDLLERARESGQLRADVTMQDLVVALAQLARPLPGVDCPDHEEIGHRHLQMFLEGMRMPVPTEPHTAATTPEEPRPPRQEKTSTYL